ncbi:MAG: trans-aconitate 2-methyltransferase [Thermoleophilaceae bacterium]
MSSHSGPREWDADTYDRVADVQLEWGLAVLPRLPLRGDETVLDAGCGSGRLTEKLLERLPRGRLLAVDGSEDMVRKARERLGDRAEVWQADLAVLELEAPVDAVFSNAVFHWVPDHRTLFERLHQALLPGGRLVAQCGGEGNVASLTRVLGSLRTREPFRAHLAGVGGMWKFASPEQTAENLRWAGFTEIETGLQPWPVRPAHPREFLRAVSLGPHLAALPEGLHEQFLDSVQEAMGDPLELDYVRLNIDARRPA